MKQRCAVDEAGLPGSHFSLWFGLYAPKGTPKDVIAKLNAAVIDALAEPTTRQRLSDLGFEVPPQEALDAIQKADVDKWWPIIKAANIKGE
jgi:tripartite-type tricarboxylate transporter receptor subunit TctC